MGQTGCPTAGGVSPWGGVDAFSINSSLLIRGAITICTAIMMAFISGLFACGVVLCGGGGYVGGPVSAGAGASGHAVDLSSNPILRARC